MSFVPTPTSTLDWGRELLRLAWSSGQAEGGALAGAFAKELADEVKAKAADAGAKAREAKRAADLEKRKQAAAAKRALRSTLPRGPLTPPAWASFLSPREGLSRG